MWEAPRRRIIALLDGSTRFPLLVGIIQLIFGDLEGPVGLIVWNSKVVQNLLQTLTKKRPNNDLGIDA